MIDAEKTLLRHILVNPSCLTDVDFLTNEDFLSNRHREIFAACVDMFSSGKPVDVISVSEVAGDFDYIVELSMIDPISSHMPAAKAVQKESFKRKAIQKLDNARFKVIESNCMDEQIGFLAEVPEGMDRPDDEFKPLNTIIKESIDRLNDRMQGIFAKSVKVGFKDIDERLGGVQPSDFMIIAGRPSMGKTAYAMNVAENVAMSGGNVLVFSLEMSEAQLMDRMLSSVSGVKADSIKRGKLDENELSQLMAGGHKLKTMNLNIIDRPAMHINHLSNIARKFHRTRPLDMIVIDYLQLMRGTSKDRLQEISEISRGLKALAKTLDVAVVALSQLSRGVDSRTSKKPVMSDLRESGQIEQDADIIQFLYRDEYYNESSELKGYCEVITSKFRNGETGSDFIQSELDRCRFGDAQFVPKVTEKPVYAYKRE